MDRTTILELFQYCYHTLESSLPMNDLSFITQLKYYDLLPEYTESSLYALPTNKEKASYFLNNVIKPQLNHNDNVCFDTLLEIMVRNDNDNLKNIAAMIYSAAKIKLEVIADTRKHASKFV